MSLSNNIYKEDVITVTRDCPITQAVELMAENHIGNLVVVEKQGQNQVPIGVVTDRDIAIKTMLREKPASALVGDIMSSDLVTVRKSDGIYDVIEVMKAHGVNRVPVVDDQENLVGILTAADILELISDELSILSSLGERQKTREKIQLSQQ